MFLLTVPRVAFAAWSITPYDPAPYAGFSPSVVLGSGPFVDAVVPEIAYWTPGVGFRFYDGATSQSAQPPLAPGTPPDQVQLIHTGAAALAFDFSGKPWIAEATLDADHPENNTLTMAHLESGVWVGEPMGQTNGLLSLEYDRAAMKLHLFHWTSGGMVYAWRQNGTWHTEPFSPANALGTMKLDKFGNPVVAYKTPDGIYYATRAGNGWQSALVETRSSVGVPVLAMSGTGHPRIAYGYSVGVEPGDYFLRFASEVDGVWSTEPVAVAGGSVYEYDLAMLGDRPLIAYTDTHVNFATKETGGWTSELVDPDGAGQNPSVVASGPHAVIAYQASAFGARYATSSVLVGIPPASPIARLELAALNVPAPRGAALSLRVSVPAGTGARLEAFDAAGRSVGAPAHVVLVAGPNRLTWSAPSNPGLVFLRIVTDDGEVATTRAVIL